MKIYLEHLNDSQRKAVEFGIAEEKAASNPLLIIAGAGSGKTNTLAHRVAHLIKNGADPQRIMLLTFTRRAADEMIRRTIRILSDLNKNSDIKLKVNNVSKVIWSGTFHSVANRILRIYSEAIKIDSSFTVMDRSDSADLMNRLRNDLALSEKKKRFPKKDTCLAIYSHVVNSLGTIEQTLEKSFPWCEKWAKELKQLFKSYAEKKRQMNVMDYDDLLLFWYHMTKSKKVAESLSKRFDYILVDEYQDTNKLQADIIKAIKPDGRGITVVGDDAQSIYSFRAATVRNILDFPDQFSNKAEIITLDRNYRSTTAILDASNSVIGKSKERFTKDLFSHRKSQEKPVLTLTEDEPSQASYVAEKVLEYRESGIPLVKQAVLFRSSHHSADLEVELARRNIPYVKYGGLKFLEAAHVKDMVSILRWIENPRDAISSFRVLQLLEGVGPASAMKIIRHLEDNNFSFESLKKFKPSASFVELWPDLCKLLNDLKGNKIPWEGQMEYVKNWYTPHFEKIYDADPSRQKDLDQLVQISAKFPHREKFLSDMALDPPNITSDEAEDPNLDEDYLILSTIHSAKGQEWNAVFVLNVADGWIPSDMAVQDQEQIEEERRLFYVAMTRAKDHLHLSYPLRFFKYNYKHVQGDRNMYSIRSRFITDDILPHFHQEAYGKAHVDDLVADIDEVNINIADAISSFWD